MAWTNPRTWVAGETVTAAILNIHLRDNLKAIGDAWTAYTPTWTAITTNPTLGNGTITGVYMQAGKLVHFRVRTTFGSTTNVGSGAYSWALPATATAQHIMVGTALIRSSSGGSRRFRFGRTATTDTVLLEDQDGVQVTHNTPLAWATGDTIDISGAYEAA